MNIETVIIDDKKYLEVDKIDIKNNTYIYLVNSADENDFCIRKLTSKDGEIYYSGLEDEKEFELALLYFTKKHENILE